MSFTERTSSDYSRFLSCHLPYKVQKVGVNGGFSCPNRDGLVGLGGCTYCNNQSFSPDYCLPTIPLREQLEEGMRFFSRKHPTLHYLAYFQSYTNSYAALPRLRALYEEALSVEKVVGLVIGTRPDCMSDELLDYLAELSERCFVLIEYGVESTHDRTLRLINRGHDFACAVDAINRTHARGILCGAHLILGLPGESREAILENADRISELPIDVLKLHQLQLIRHTVMAHQYEEHPEWFRLYTADDYIDLCIDFLDRLPDRIVVERYISQSPEELLIAPRWGLKNVEFTNLLFKRIKERF